MEELLYDLITLISNNLPYLSTVDEDYGQLEFIDQNDRDSYPLTFPAVLIDAPSTDWSDIADLAQKGICQVRVRLIIDCYDDTHAHSKTTNRISNREAKRKELHVLLQGFRTTGGGELIRKSSKFFTVNHGIKVYESTYTVSVSENVIDRRTVPKTKITLAVKP